MMVWMKKIQFRGPFFFKVPEKSQQNLKRFDYKLLYPKCFRGFREKQALAASLLYNEMRRWTNRSNDTAATKTSTAELAPLIRLALFASQP